MQRRSFLAGALATGATPLGGCAGPPAQAIRAEIPPVGRLIEVDGLQVHAWERGTGQPVVLIHGASGNLRDWTFGIAPALARRYRVIAFDRPGFGYSDRLPVRGWEPGAQAAHLAAAARRLGDEQPIVVGHSWGGAVAMAWGLMAPDDVRGLVSLSGATMPFEGGVGLANRLAASPLGPLVGAAVSALATERQVAGRVAAVFAPQQVPPGYLDHLGWRLATRADSFVWNARDLDNLAAALGVQAAHYPGLRAPVEILHGTADRIVPHDIHAMPMHALLPSSRLTLIEGMGHMPHHFAQAGLAEAIGRLAAL